MKHSDTVLTAPLADPHANRIVPIVTVTVVDNRDRVLLLKRQKPGQIFENYWEVVGGRIEFGETSAEAARRELSEEAGILARPEFVTVLEHVGRRSEVVSKSYHRIMFVYVVTVKENRVIKSEHRHYRWLDIANLPTNIIPFNKEALSHALAHISLYPEGQLPLFAQYAFERRLVLIKGGGSESENMTTESEQYSLFDPI